MHARALRLFEHQQHELRIRVGIGDGVVAADRRQREMPHPIVERIVGGVGKQRGQDEREIKEQHLDRKSTRLNSSHIPLSRMPSSA